MQMVTLGATDLEVTPLAYGTWQFGGDWGPVDERAAIEAIQHCPARRGLGVLADPTVQVAIVGARTPVHLAESPGAVDLTLSQADLAEIDHIMAAAGPAGDPTPQGMA